MKTIKALQLSQMEEDLKETMKEIRKITNFMNLPRLRSMKKVNEKKLIELMAKKQILEMKIAEGVLLE